MNTTTRQDYGRLERSPTTTNISRLNNLLASFESGHFENHVVEGAIVRLEEGCAFCEPYLQEKVN